MNEDIYILDDDKPTLEIIENILKSNRFKVRTFSSPSSLIDRLGVKVPKLLILDILMPEINGLKLCEKLRAMEGLEDVPIVILSSKVSGSDKKEAFRSGANGFITKPFNARELVFAIKTYINLPKI